ncbi:hypothetical protein ACE1CA_13580 [Aerosakkonemataceae cyanobacterium BLCC-F167]|uniref:Nucleotide pyrophosphohydrolase n=2 Tax=Floridanema TaxID=3396149 RepID=A0ABV4WKE1_9CYAN
METEKLNFLADNQSVASLVSQLQEYFKNSYSHFQVKRSRIVSDLHATSGENEQELIKQLQDVDAALTIFGILSDVMSAADKVLHAKAVMQRLGLDSEIYELHHQVKKD